MKPMRALAQIGFTKSGPLYHLIRLRLLQAIDRRRLRPHAWQDIA